MVGARLAGRYDGRARLLGIVLAVVYIVLRSTWYRSFCSGRSD
jgi:hypothetical protein